jgi:putative peptide zinc metalloprotease protein
MWYFIGLLLVTLGIVYASTISFSGISRFITPAHIISYMPLALCSCIVHELGHAAACARFGMKAGSIGFGFYLFMPVFYADVSSAWRLSSGKRIIINIAGMYFQLLISFILVIIYAITGNDWMLYASLINIISFLPNLNPFVRYDGYWILTDLLGINNIIQNAEKSFERTREWFRGKMKEEFPIRTAKDKFLLCYFLINRIVVVLLLSVFFVVNGYSILYFPSRFLNFISSPELFSFSFFKTFILENLVSFFFYILLFSLIKRFFIRKKAGPWL